MQKAKAFAFTIILVMMVVNFIIPRPWVPTFPHKSWNWLTPWPVQVLQGAGPSEGRRVAKADLSEADKIFFGALVAALGFVLGNSLMALNEAIVEGIVRALEGGGSSGGEHILGGGGREMLQP